MRLDFNVMNSISQRLELMRHIYNGEEGDFTDLTVAPEPAPGNAAQPAGVATQLAALPPRCVFSCLTQNMCVGESTTGLQITFHPKIHTIFEWMKNGSSQCVS